MRRQGRGSLAVRVAAWCGLVLLLAGFWGVSTRVAGTPSRSEIAVPASTTVAAASGAGASQGAPKDELAAAARYASSSLPLRREGDSLGVAIRDLPLATWIIADNPETVGNLGLDYGRIDPRYLRVVRLRMEKPDGGELLVDRLEFVDDRDDAQVAVGSTRYLSYPELGVTGDAEVLAIAPAPRIPPRPSPRHCLVTSKFTHDAAEVLDLRLAGLDGTIGVTPNHPVWSDDRREFVRADSLLVGESLLDARGVRVAVQAIVPRPGRTAVFNLEVDGEHVYHVSAQGLLFDNNCTFGSKEFGDMQHASFGDNLKAFTNTRIRVDRTGKRHTGVDVTFRESVRGLKGVDGKIPGAVRHAELKPWPESGLATFQKQLENWRANGLKGNVGLFMYKENGDLFFRGTW